MAADIEVKRKLRAIRRLSASFPDRTAEERLGQIEGIASGKLEPGLFRRPTSPDLLGRLKRGQASRSPRTAADKRPVKKAEPEPEPEKKKRSRRGGHDREERGGFDRSEI